MKVDPNPGVNMMDIEEDNPKIGFEVSQK